MSFEWADKVSGEQGKKAEDEFKDILYWKFGKQAEIPHEKENIYGHIDFRVDGHGYDVKSRKAIRRGRKIQDNFQWIEYQNISGNAGWLRGLSHTIAFELKHTWMLVNRVKLLEYVRPKLNLDDVEILNMDTPVPWQIYKRKDKEDRIFLIPLSEILITEPVIWRK